MIAAIGAGCSSGSPETGTSTTGTAGGADSTGELGLEFAECMRANGVEDFPDPDVSGGLTIDAIANRTSVDTDSAQFDQALTACKDLQPAGFTGTERTPEQQQAALEFAQCIRDNGVPDFPDPTTDSPMVDTNRIPSAGTERGMTILHAAMKMCGGFAERAGVTGP